MVSFLDNETVRGFVRIKLLDHGNEWCAREPTSNMIFCFNKHSGYVLCRLSVRKVIQFSRAKVRRI